MRYWIDTQRSLEKIHGDSLNTTELYLSFRHFYLTDERIVVARISSSAPEGEREVEHTRRGRIGMTTGWRPSFLVMPKSTSIGSSDVVSAWDVPVALIHQNNSAPFPLVKCGEGHYGTRKSPCVKYLGHGGSCDKEKAK